MRALADLSGQRFGRLLALEYVGRSAASHPMWFCECECGSFLATSGAQLLNGRTRSCGCLKRDLAGKASVTHGDGNSNVAEYRIWAGMLSRCRNESNAAYPRYGGRGITVCDRWLAYENFLSDMGRRPSEAHSLERERNDECYGPGNCKWATRAEQCRNRRSNVVVEFAGESMVLKDAAEAAGLPYKTVHARLKRGWSVGDALRAPVANRGQVH